MEPVASVGRVTTEDPVPRSGRDQDESRLAVSDSSSVLASSVAGLKKSKWIHLFGNSRTPWRPGSTRLVCAVTSLKPIDE